MTELMEQTNHYLTDFERFEKEPASPGLHRLRKAAIARFAELGFPCPRDEEWRFTPVGPLVKRAFRLASAAPAPDAGEQAPPAGVVVSSLAEALGKHPQLVEPHLARYADYKRHPFVALNTAFLRDGFFVHVPAGMVVETPILLPSVAATVGDAPPVWHRRSLVVLGAKAKATVAETFAGPAGVTYFTNAVAEIVVGDHAVLDHYKIQEEGDKAYHVAVTPVQIGRSARFSSHSIALGGAWVRNEVNAVFAGPGGECTLNGLYRAGGEQLLANYTLIDHAHPRCASHELYKGVLGGKAKGVFNGKIYVRQDAQKTDAKQTNKTLLLSDDATINAKPQLEIYADDVKCTHGATVGQLDAEAIFYLRSRGVGEREARALLAYAFANDIIGRIKVDSIRERLGAAFLSAGGLPPSAPSEVES